MDNNNQYFDLDSLTPKQAPASGGKDRNILSLMIGFLIGVIMASLVTGSIFTLVMYNSRSSQKSGTGTTNTIELKEDSIIDKTFIQKMYTIEQMIDKMFYLGEVSDEEIREKIYKAVLDSLEDPYSVYYTEEEFMDLVSRTSGVYYGIGAYLSADEKTGLPVVASVIKGTPAEEVGLHAQDMITCIDGESISGLSLTEAVARIKGDEGTTVKLTILRGEETFDVDVVRRKVESPTVTGKMLDDQIGYISIAEFDDVTDEQFADALADLKSQNMKGLILDLRANPGGNLDVVVNIGDMLLPKGTIVYTEDKDGKREVYESSGKNELMIPMTVLVDMNSASAAEILAGAIQDYQKGTLIGTTTYGKGIVQALKSLKDGSAVKITISAYYTPNGRNIHGIGIEPDIEVKFDGETYYGSNGEIDNQLDKAKEVLLEMMQQ